MTTPDWIVLAFYLTCTVLIGALCGRFINSSSNMSAAKLTVAGKWKQLGVRTPAECPYQHFGHFALHFYTIAYDGLLNRRHGRLISRRQLDQGLRMK